MNNITKTLLAGAALCALATAPAVAWNVPAFSFTALHAGRVVNKTRIHDAGCLRCGYSTLTISTYIPASDLKTSVHLLDTYYKWNSNNSLCTAPVERNIVPRKSTYARLGKATETYSEGCSNGPTVFYGDTYKLKTAAGEGHTDYFVSTLIGKFQNNGVKYKGKLHLDVFVHIGE